MPPLRLTAPQRRVWDALSDDRRIFYWPPRVGGRGSFAIGRRRGDYDRRALSGPSIPISTIEAMAAKGALVEVARFHADATASGQNAAVEYRRADRPLAEA